MIKKTNISGKTTSEIIEMLTVYKDVISMPAKDFGVFIQSLGNQEFDFVIKCIKGQVLIGCPDETTI